MRRKGVAYQPTHKENYWSALASDYSFLHSLSKFLIFFLKVQFFYSVIADRTQLTRVTKRVAMIRNRLFSSPCLHFLSKVLIFPKFLSSAPYPDPLLSTSAQEINTAYVEDQIRHLCQNPNSGTQPGKLYWLFDKSLATGRLPSSPTCNLLFQTLVKNKEHNMALSVYRKMIDVGILFAWMAMLLRLKSF